MQWSALDIRRIPTLVKEVDELLELLQTADGVTTQKAFFKLHIKKLIDSMEEFIVVHKSDPRIGLVENQLLRLRKAYQKVAAFTDTVQEETVTHDAPVTIKSTSIVQKCTQSKVSDVKIRPEIIELDGLKYQKLDIPGHYTHGTQSNGTLPFEFDIILSAHAAQRVQSYKRQYVAEQKHRHRSGTHASPNVEVTTTPFVDAARLEANLFR